MPTLPQTILEVGLLLRELVGLLRQVVQLLRGVLPLHPVQDVVRFLQTLGRAPLSGSGLIGLPSCWFSAPRMSSVAFFRRSRACCNCGDAM